MRSRALYTPPVTPRKSATPEAGEPTSWEVRGEKLEVGIKVEIVSDDFLKSSHN